MLIHYGGNDLFIFILSVSVRLFRTYTFSISYKRYGCDPRLPRYARHFLCMTRWPSEIAVISGLDGTRESYPQSRNLPLLSSCALSQPANVSRLSRYP